LGGLVLLVLLTMQHARFRPRPLALDDPARRALKVATPLLWVQIALGGWVSTNYAVLACGDFPTCNGQWWPAMDLAAGFALLRPLGQAAGGGFLPFDALVAIHMVHRLFAVAAALALLWLAAALWRGAPSLVAPGRGAPLDAAARRRRFAAGIALVTLMQIASGLGNVVLGWPIVAALLHSAGAAALVGLLTLLAMRGGEARAQGAMAGRWVPAA
jgi:cytochrome c oxidase assembly protein subunit 15